MCIRDRKRFFSEGVHLEEHRLTASCGDGRQPDRTVRILEHGQCQTQAVAAHHAVPVSYTHLDVYKRQDVHRLIEVLQKLVDAGNTVIVIEHNLDPVSYTHLGSGSGRPAPRLSPVFQWPAAGRR